MGSGMDGESTLMKSQMKKSKKKKKQEVDQKNDQNEAKDNIVQDPRFQAVHYDPRFQKVPRKKAKVAIDSRFDKMFTDKNFGSSSATNLDKRGKTKMQKSDASLRHYYQLDVLDEGEDKENIEDEEKEKVDIGVVESNEIDSTSDCSVESEGNIDGDDSKEDVEESDEDVGSIESTTDDEELIFEEDVPEVEEEQVPVVDEGTRRLAVVDMDWRHVRAVDLLVLLRSCLAKSGDIVSVAVYPSEFGLKQMNEEERRGPVGLFDDETTKNDSDQDDEIDFEKLRAYEKSRLRYYYAVVECDSVATADHIYKFCDGTELERSSNKLDLRFIPDSMEFKHPPRDVATEVPTTYEGLDFHTKALQHSNIPISWDEDEPNRVKALRAHFKNNELEDLDLKDFLASDGSDSDDEDQSGDNSASRKVKADKYKSLIQSGDGSEASGDEGVQDMEVTFNPGLEDLSKHILEKKNKKSESVWDEYLKRRREKKKARKRKIKESSDDESSDDDEAAAQELDDFFSEEPTKFEHTDTQQGYEDTGACREELELLLADGDENGAKGYNMKLKKGKDKKGKVIDDDKIPSLNYEDPRFSKLFSSPLFALDPTDPQFKKSATYARQMAQKQRRDECKLTANSDLPVEHSNSHVDASMTENLELQSLVRSVKKKSKKLVVGSDDTRISKKK